MVDFAQISLISRPPLFLQAAFARARTARGCATLCGGCPAPPHSGNRSSTSNERLLSYMAAVSMSSGWMLLWEVSLTVAVIISTAVTVFIYTLPSTYSHFRMISSVN